MNTLDIILSLIKEKKVTPNRVATSCGLQSNAFTLWKSGKAKPSLDACIKIADYFNVSLDYLVGRETPTMINVDADQNAENITFDATTATLLNACTQLNKLQQQKVLTYINDITGANTTKSLSPVMSVIREAEAAARERATKEVYMQQEKKDV